MEEYKYRVFKEKEDLDEKIDKLTIFLGSKIYENLSYDEKDALSAQLFYMSGYSKILEKRIANFKEI